MGISLSTARVFCELDNDFYHMVAPSFSQTRHNVWPGQARCAQIISTCVRHAGRTSATVLDVASGNGRFECALGSDHPQIRFSCVAADATLGMARSHLGTPQNVDVSFEQADFMGPLTTATSASRANVCGGEDELAGLFARLKRSANAGQSASDAPFDASVCFGFFHHIPLQSWRRAILKNMCDVTSEHGVVAVSLWRFLRDPQMERRAQNATRRAFEVGVAGLHRDDLGPNDFFLRWQNHDVFRYCHSATDEEVCDLASLCPSTMRPVLFSSDGKHGDLNDYLVFVPNDVAIGDAGQDATSPLSGQGKFA